MVVICSDCGRRMPEAATCTATHLVFIPREPVKRRGGAIIYPRDTRHHDQTPRCHDCGIINAPGKVHHGGCDVERCPRCSLQLISCTCWDSFQIVSAAFAPGQARGKGVTPCA